MKIPSKEDKKRREVKMAIIRPVGNILHLNKKEEEELLKLHKRKLESIMEKILKGTINVSVERIPVEDETGTANILWHIWKSARTRGKIVSSRNYTITLPGGVLLGCYAKARMLYQNIGKTTKEVK